MATKQTNQNSRLTERRKQRSAFGKFVSLFFFGFVAIITVNALGAKSDIFVSGKWRYRMTVAVETPEGLKTGSAVREVRVEKGLKLLPEMGASVELTGEAIVVDLGKRGVLFALIDEDAAWRIVFDLFPVQDLAPLTSEGIRYYSSLKNAKATLDPGRYPLLVRFRDLRDPTTVEALCSGEVMEKCKKRYLKRQVIPIDEAFGKGVRIKEVVFEMTDDPVTSSGIIDKLPWLEALQGGYLSPEEASTYAPVGLHSGYFKRGHVNGR